MFALRSFQPTTSILTRNLIRTMSTPAANKDSYTIKASKDAIPSQKIEEVRNIMKSSKFGMLTTIDSSGQLNSRMMSPASTESLSFSFIGNLASGKFDELNENRQVNLSFADKDSTNWISVSGTAKVITDTETITKLWSKDTEAWFRDEGDGIHDGTYKDPRVGVIEIETKEIRYWYRTTTAIGQAYEVSSDLFEILFYFFEEDSVILTLFARTLDR